MKNKYRNAYYNQLLKQSSVFFACPRDLCNKYSKLFKIYDYKKNDVIIRIVFIIFIQNTPGDYLFVIVEGTIKVTIPKPNSDDEILLRILREGDFAGEVALINNVPRSADCIAQTNVVLMGLHKVLFNRVFNLQISLWEGAYSLLFGTEYSNVFFKIY